MPAHCRPDRFEYNFPANSIPQPDCRNAKPGRRDGERSNMKELSMKLRELGRTHNNKGQAMVETALVLMLLVVLIFGMTEFGRAMYTKNMLNNAARAGARCAVVQRPSGGTPPTLWTSDDIANITACAMSAVFYVTNPVTVTITDVGKGSGVGVAPVTGDTITVDTQTTFNSMVPRLIGPTGLIPLTSTFTGHATMRYE